jgi:hypothetical protein
LSDEAERIRQDAAERRQEVNRGEQAKRVYEDSLFKEAVEAMKDRLWDEFRAAGPSDRDALVTVRLKFQCLEDLLADLRRHMSTGRMAAEKLPFIERTLQAITRKRK